MFAACAHAAADDYAEGHFGPASHPAAYGAWLDAYHSCSSEVDAFMAPLKVGGEECETQFTTAAVAKPAVDVRTWSEREAAAQSNQELINKEQAAADAAQKQQAEAAAKKQAEETRAKKELAEALVEEQAKDIEELEAEAKTSNDAHAEHLSSLKTAAAALAATTATENMEKDKEIISW